MAECVSPADITDYEQTPHSNKPTDNPNLRDVTQLNLDVQDKAAREAADSTRLIEEAYKLMSVDDTSMPNYSKVTTEEKRMPLDSVASELARELIPEADKANAARTQAWIDAQEAVDTTSVSGYSWWRNMTFGFSEKYINSRAKVENFIHTFFGMPDRGALNNEFIMSFRNMEPLVQSNMQKVLKRNEDFLKTLWPIVKRLGFDSPYQVAVTMGEYANAIHAPEANAHLLQRWEKEINDEYDKIARDSNGNILKFVKGIAADANGKPIDLNLIKSNNAKIALLRKHIDDIDPPEHLWSSGITNGQAAKMKADILKMGFTEAELEAGAKWMTDFANDILRARVKAGVVPIEQLQEFPDYTHYIPFHSKADQVKGAINDSTSYNPGKYHAMRGSNNRPDSGYVTLLNYARRAALEIGMQDFALHFAAMAKKGRGVRLYDYEQLVAIAGDPTNPYYATWASNLLNKGGMVVRLPGEKKTSYVAFDIQRQSFDEIGGVSGMQLNQALLSSPKMSVALNPVTVATSSYGQLFTRFQPAFAFKNSIMDFFERSFHIAGDDFYDKNGNKVYGSDLLPAYFANATHTGFTLLEGLRGNLDPNSKAGQYFKAYMDNGLFIQFIKRIKEDARSLEDVTKALNDTSKDSVVMRYLGKENIRELKHFIRDAGEHGDKVIKLLDSWNDWLNNAAQFNHFVTFLEAGADVKTATAHALASMNLYQTGTATPVLRALYPFVKPTFQSSAAMMRTLGFAWDPRGFIKMNHRGQLYTVAVAGALMSLIPLIRESLGRDPETGKYRYDMISLGSASRFIPIPIDDKGTYLKLPWAYGPGAVVATAMIGLDRVDRGEMTVGDWMADVAFSFVKNSTPGNYPEFYASDDPAAYITQTIAPSILGPIMEVATNRSYFGRPILSGYASGDDYRRKADKGRMSTPSTYHKWARFISDNFHFDLAPEQVRALYEGYLTGAAQLFKDAWLSFDNAFSESPAEQSLYKSMNPWLRAMGGTQLAGSVANVGQSVTMRARDYYMRRVREAGVPIAEPHGKYDEWGDKAHYQQAMLRQSGKFTEQEIADILLLEKVYGQLGKISSELSKNFRQAFIAADKREDLIPIFEQVAEEKRQLYTDAARNLHYGSGL